MRDFCIRAPTGNVEFVTFRVLNNVLCWAQPMGSIRMVDAFLRMPLRFWLRVGTVFSVLWLVIISLVRWSWLSREHLRIYFHNLGSCHLHAVDSGSACVKLAEHQLEVSSNSVLPLSIGTSIFQLALIWALGAVIVGGSRWVSRIAIR